MTNSDFIDFKSVSAVVIQNKNRLDSGKRLNWMHCKWLQFSKGSCIVGIKNELDDSPFQQLCATNIDTVQFTDHIRETMKPMYSGPVPISSAKYKDLQYLCKTKVIPEQFHQFYNNLKYSSREVDKLDEPDMEEDSDVNDDTEVNCPAENALEEDTVLSHQVINSVPSTMNSENGTTGHPGTSKPRKSVPQSVLTKSVRTSASRRSTRRVRLTADVQIANDHLGSRETQSKLRTRDGVTTKANIHKGSSVPTFSTRRSRKSIRLTAAAGSESDRQKSCEPPCKQRKLEGPMVRMRK